MQRRVFISWSGARSKRVAQSLRTWLPDVLQNLVPFMSEEDIAKGERGADVISRELSEAAVGIICLTPENLTAPWVLFEAGALSNSFQARDRLCPYLLGLRKADVSQPLAQFQLTEAEREDTFRLVAAINSSFDGEFRAAEADLRRRFDKWWPDLEAHLQSIAAEDVEHGRQVRRTGEEILTEILEVVRRLERDEANRSAADEFAAFEELANLRERGAQFILGDMVIHSAFGRGTIVGLKADSLGDMIVDVAFDSGETKRVVQRYAKLRKLELTKDDGMDIPHG